MRSARKRSRSLATYFMRGPSLSPVRRGITSDATVANAATAENTITRPSMINTVTTNVQGPPQALYAVGRKLIEYLPFVPLSQGVRLGFAILSYNGNLAFGVTGDFDTVPEVEWFCRRIEAGIAELRDHARPAAKPEAANRARHPKVPA